MPDRSILADQLTREKVCIMPKYKPAGSQLRFINSKASMNIFLQLRHKAV